jgi:hypothetical protein
MNKDPQQNLLMPLSLAPNYQKEAGLPSKIVKIFNNNIAKR